MASNVTQALAMLEPVVTRCLRIAGAGRRHQLVSDMVVAFRAYG
jgi:hypothetical protein